MEPKRKTKEATHRRKQAEEHGLFIRANDLKPNIKHQTSAKKKTNGNSARLQYATHVTQTFLLVGTES